jgi:hypothetical protein
MNMPHLLRNLWSHDQGQDIAEYVVINGSGPLPLEREYIPTFA